MSGKRRHQESLARQQARKERDFLAAKARGLPVDLGELAPYEHNDPPHFLVRGFYSDVPFSCRRCGGPQVWTAERQKWWFEVVKGPPYSFARHCRPCRQAIRLGGDPNRYKDVEQILSKVHSEVDPRLKPQGFAFVGRGPHNARPSRRVRRRSLEYNRGDALLSIAWNQHQASLEADLLDSGGDDLRRVAVAAFGGCCLTADFDARIDVFVREVERAVTTPADAAADPHRDDGAAGAP